MGLQIKYNGNPWAITFRGPWAKSWKEFKAHTLAKPGTWVTFVEGRKIIKEGYEP